MKRKNLLTVMLTVLLCFGVVFAANALPNTKDLVVEQIKNMSFNVDKGFYEKAESKGYIEVKKFDGTVAKEVGDLKGLKVDLLAQIDGEANAIKLNLDTKVKGQPYQADVYIADDKVILDKSLFSLIQSFAGEIDELKELENAPQYLYISDKEIKSFWEQLAVYQKQQYPEEFKDLLVFFVEAIPDKYFSVTNGKLVIKLDQKGFEETVYNLLTKIENEKERFADIIVSFNKYTAVPVEGTPEEMKAEIIAGLEEMEVPTKEQISEISKYVDINLLIESSLVPGGKKNIDFTANFKGPEDLFKGQLVFKADLTGKDADLKGSSQLTGNVVIQEGPTVDLEFKSNADYQGPKGKSDMVLNVKAIDNTTKENYCDISIYGQSNDAVKPDLTVNVPQLTEENSLDLATVIPKVEIPQYVAVQVNGEYLESDVIPYIKDGRTMVPVRAIAEALDCEVEWVEPNEVRITRGEDVIQMYIEQATYNINGIEKQLDVVPFIEDGSTMVPVRFVAEALGATVGLDDGTVIITK